MTSLPFSSLCAARCNHTGIMTSSTAGAEASLPCLTVKLSLEPDVLWRALLQLWGCALLLCPILFLPHLRLCTLHWHNLGSAARGHLWQRNGNWELGQFCFKPLCQGLPGLGGVVGGGSGRKHDCTLGSDFSTCTENQFVFIGVLPEDFEPLFFLTLHCG